MKRGLFTVFLTAAAVGFCALGLWQVERLGWKRALIADTALKLQAAPVDAPAPDAWPGMDADQAYKRVLVRGHYLTEKDTFVVASTRYGRGFWVMTPMKTDNGFVVLINRGFVTSAQKEGLGVPRGPVSVEGLLRLSEPKGSLLQANQPEHDRWYSRDVHEIARVRGLDAVAPYFVDADGRGEQVPAGGLTVVEFRNHHLQYALTWFGLAAMSLGGIILVWRPARSRLQDEV